MPLIPQVGRRSAKVRIVFALLYLALTAGAVTTVYPFLIMLGSSVTSDYDQNRYDIVPAYLREPTALFAKYAEDKYGGDPAAISAAYGKTFATLQDVQRPPAIDRGKADDWDAFFAALPSSYKQAGFMGKGTAYTPSRILNRYQDFLRSRFHGDLGALDRAYTEEDTTFLSVFPPFEQPAKHTWLPDRSRKTQDWRAFEATLSPDWFRPVLADPIYDSWLKEEPYNGRIADLNAAWGTHYAAFADIPLSASPTGNAAQRKDWETFVRTKLPLPFVAVAADAAPSYRAFLQGRYHGDIDAYDKAYGATATSFDAVTLPRIETLPPAGPPLLDWLDYLKSAAPLQALSADTVETRYRVWAAPRYGLDAVAASAIRPPVWQSDTLYASAHVDILRRDYVTRNYKLVLDYLVLHGRSLWTTVIYCTLAVLTALIVNPLCAYALSRFRLPYGTSVLLFLLATMAFPVEVSTIPNFLLLKQLNLLNTFWALLLPGAANGFWIFLLKGFFDSLPKDLYEAGVIDGASEMRMFWSITLPLSGPIFAVIALNAFTAAFSNFLFALIICQDPRMWTLMVWVYELQASGAPDYVMLAALTLVSVPTLLVFILAQRVIMRGIIVPTEK